MQALKNLKSINASYHIIPYHIISYHIISYIISYHVIYHVIYHVMSSHAMSSHVMPCHLMSCHVISCHAMSCHAMPCHAMPCHAMPCHVLSCLVLSYIIYSFRAISQHDKLMYNGKIRNFSPLVGRMWLKFCNVLVTRYVLPHHKKFSHLDCSFQFLGHPPFYTNSLTLSYEDVRGSRLHSLSKTVMCVSRYKFY